MTGLAEGIVETVGVCWYVLCRIVFNVTCE